MRSINDIQIEILAAKNQASSLNALIVLTSSEQTLTDANSTSKVSIWRLWVWIFSYAIWVHEQISIKNAANSRPQNLPNFIESILDFRDGLDLKWKDGRFNYDYTGINNAEARKIIARCAVLESVDGELVIKVARMVAEILQPLTPEQLERLEFYIKQKKVPGVQIRLINEAADLIKTRLNVYVDPLMIDLSNGKQLNSSDVNYPAKDAINDYLGKLEFNGAFVTNFFTRAIEDKDGINLVEVELMQWSFDSLPFEDFTRSKVAESGYFKINNVDLEINYLPYVLVNN